MEDDIPPVDNNTTIPPDEFIAWINKVHQSVLDAISNGIAVNMQIDTTKFLKEGRIVIRIFVNYGELAPKMSDVFPNPFEDLPECEEPDDHQP